MINHVNCAGIHGNMLKKLALGTLTPSDTRLQSFKRANSPKAMLEVAGAKARTERGALGPAPWKDAMKY